MLIFVGREEQEKAKLEGKRRTKQLRERRGKEAERKIIERYHKVTLLKMIWVDKAGYTAD